MMFIGIHKGTSMIGVARFDGEPAVSFIDSMHDSGYTIKAITEKEYNEYSEGDELTMEELREGKYKKENINQ